MKKTKAKEKRRKIWVTTDEEIDVRNKMILLPCLFGKKVGFFPPQAEWEFTGRALLLET